MTGLEKMAAAFSPDGAAEFPVVTCYTGIFERDHFFALTDLPWWHLYETDPRKSAALTAALTAATDFDWFTLYPAFSHAEQQAIRIVDDAGRVFRVDARDGSRTELFPPKVSGTLSTLEAQAPHIDELSAFLEERIPPATPFRGLEAGREQHPRLLMDSLGQEKCALRHVASPMWAISSILGYRQWFEFLATDPEPIYAGCRRLLETVIGQVEEAAASGCHAIWIEECLTDQIGPERFARYNLPLMRELTEAIRRAGLWSIYYYCGNPWPVWDMLLDAGADALSLEESKKDFRIDIDEVVDRTRGKLTLFGNLDTCDLLEKASDQELQAEIARQLAAGRRNGRRFVMSTGSPITPATSVARVRDYVALVRELGGA